MEIPHDALPPDTLRRVIEEFVTREGTDYGQQEVSLAEKVTQVLEQLKRGDAVLVFDERSQTCHITTRTG